MQMQLLRTTLQHVKKSWSVVRSVRLNASLAAQPVAAQPSPWVGRWLFGCSGMVFGAVALGGLTRLTESGLSMTDWHLFGKRPPMGHLQWMKEFEQYQQFPEFQQKNKDMTLNEFKFIWWMEYGHRQWGRTIGVFFTVPAIYFWRKGHLSGPLKKRVLVMGALIGFQGLLGWYMVKSGLEAERFTAPSDVPRVSQYRLASHLGSAFVLYSLFLWNGLSVSFPPQALKEVSGAALRYRRVAHACKAWVFVTAISGAFVAGLDAGLVYNSFPKMADRWLPSDLWALEPRLRNFTENPTTVQFDHRIMGTTTLALASGLALWGRRVALPPRAPLAFYSLAACAWMQVGLGVSTLLLYVPVWLASLHQCGSLATLSAALWLSHELKLLKRLPK